jgi:hypothetical protein
VVEVKSSFSHRLRKACSPLSRAWPGFTIALSHCHNIFTSLSPFQGVKSTFRQEIVQVSCKEIKMQFHNS